ncbi:hypothetical protein ACMT1E_07510 [Sphingomonas flavalba]|uniref:hypothetical protein n=1 Tax=Sphingomonas flavalba TaxID=2559804 RepID=UPI0039DF7C46
MSRRADPLAALCRCLARRAPGLTVIESRSRPWASVTFTGARHRVVAMVPDGQRAALLDGLDCDELPLPGHIVADIAAAEEGDAIVIEALTVEAD